MARFRRGAATNWEGRPWRTSPAVNARMDEIEAAFPARHAAEGTVAGKNHDKNSSNSDHRPYPYKGAGQVNAVGAGEAKESSPTPLPTGPMLKLLQLAATPERRRSGGAIRATHP